MTRTTVFLVQALALLLLQSASSGANEVRELTWDDLIPPEELLRLQQLYGAAGTVDHGAGDDWDEELGEDDDWEDDSFEDVPATPAFPTGIVDELDGVQAKLPGFIVPLEFGDEGKIKEFLLVPYFGACIHYPPPPPNQIVYVILENAVQVESTWAPIWAIGEMKTEFQRSDLGSAGYTMLARGIEEYEY